MFFDCLVPVLGIGYTACLERFQHVLLAIQLGFLPPRSAAISCAVSLFTTAPLSYPCLVFALCVGLGSTVVVADTLRILVEFFIDTPMLVCFGVSTIAYCHRLS